MWGAPRALLGLLGSCSHRLVSRPPFLRSPQPGSSQPRGGHGLHRPHDPAAHPCAEGAGRPPPGHDGQPPLLLSHSPAHGQAAREEASPWGQKAPPGQAASQRTPRAHGTASVGGGASPSRTLGATGPALHGRPTGGSPAAAVPPAGPPSTSHSPSAWLLPTPRRCFCFQGQWPQ